MYFHNMEFKGNMWYNTLIFATLLGYANSLSCYDCSPPDSCKKPTIRTCDNVTAALSSSFLTSIYQGVTYNNGSNFFECLKLRYFNDIDNANSALQFSGCVFPQIDVCNLSLKSEKVLVIDCQTCTLDYCNRNSASTFCKSISTVSVLAWLLVKLLC